MHITTVISCPNPSNFLIQIVLCWPHKTNTKMGFGAFLELGCSQDAPRRPKMARDASRRPHRMRQRCPKMFPRSPKMPQDAPRWTQDGPRYVKTPPRCAETFPRRAQDTLGVHFGCQAEGQNKDSVWDVLQKWVLEPSWS